jgi:putative glutamine amidotransferase
MNKILIFGLFFKLCLLSVFAQNVQKQPLVLISKSYEARTYERWVRNADSTLRIKLLFGLSKDSVNYYLARANGLIMSGGEDVFPKRYGAVVDTSLCGPFDAKRDTMEGIMIQYALKNKIPLMCICRGHQLLNVEMGGTLYRDIAKEYDKTIAHPRVIKDKDSEHSVKIKANSMLASITKDTAGTINSAHHQGIERLGKGLKAVAFAPDGTIEGVELANKKGYGFVLGVQWHPERMDYKSVFSGNIARQFLDEVKKFVR